MEAQGVGLIFPIFVFQFFHVPHLIQTSCPTENQFEEIINFVSKKELTRTIIYMYILCCAKSLPEKSSKPWITMAISSCSSSTMMPIGNLDLGHLIDTLRFRGKKLFSVSAFFACAAGQTVCLPPKLPPTFTFASKSGTPIYDAS